MKSKKTYTYNYIRDKLSEKGLQLLTVEREQYNSHEQVDVTDGMYKASIYLYNYIGSNPKGAPSWFYIRNPFIIENINQYLKIHYGDSFECISRPDDCVTRESLLDIRCNRCGTIIHRSLHNMRKTGIQRNIMACPYCDGNTESVHALVLKQIFKHYYPDTVEEDRSCINPLTNHVMPTDIVNHNLRISIEVQGQYHNRESQKQRDIIKKQYWESRQYDFYDYPIDGVSVLEYVQYFFPDLKDIPDWVDFNYNSKLNIPEIQQLLNDGYKIIDIADKLNINVHRIYDALQFGNLSYPDNYVKSTRRPVVMLDEDYNYLKEYSSYADAERDNSITKGLISSCVYNKKYYSSGYYWVPKDLYTEDFVLELHNI